jgi:hypothetical protein
VTNRQLLSPNWSQPGPTTLCPGWPLGARVFRRIAARRPTTAELASRSPRDGGTSCHATLAATNKFLAPINKSRTGVKATKKRIRQKKRYRPPCACCPKTISRNHDAPRSQIDRAPSRAHSAPGALWRVSMNFRDGNETTAYYTDNLEDAVKTAVEMARTRDVVQGRRRDRRDRAGTSRPHRGHAGQPKATRPEVEE